MTAPTTSNISNTGSKGTTGDSGFYATFGPTQLNVPAEATATILGKEK